MGVSSDSLITLLVIEAIPGGAANVPVKTKTRNYAEQQWCVGLRRHDILVDCPCLQEDTFCDFRFCFPAQQIPFE